MLAATFLALGRVPARDRLSRWLHRGRHSDRHAHGSGGSDLSFHCPSCSRTFPGFSSWDEHVRLNHAL
ncbi:MAG TPA: hypothetical protein VGS23_07570 [Thermoplasmata archaeon]|nr:hypothetical protein [Thermoplasmata archaeon]